MEHCKEPLHGKWNIKATHTWELILHWRELCDIIGLHNDEYDYLILELIFHFQVVYTWSFTSMHDLVALSVFEQNVSTFVNHWARVMGGGRMDRNYYHWLAVEAMHQIKKSGSIWKYSSDITESFVHVLKDCYLRFTTRGGMRHWTRQVMSKVLIKVFVQALSCEDWYDMLTPFERKKLVKEYLSRLPHYPRAFSYYELA